MASTAAMVLAAVLALGACGDELLRIRDGLRAAGLDATTIAVLDPGTLGDGSDDDPA